MKTMLCLLIGAILAASAGLGHAQTAPTPAAPNVSAAPSPAAASDAAAKAPPVYERAFESLGSLHPAAVHMPIALLTVAAMFIVLRRFFPAISPDVAFYCLLVGAAAAVGATVLGFGFASLEGYKWDSEAIDGHRWGGVTVAVLSSVMAGLAIAARRSGNFKLQTIWQVGTLGIAAMVGFVGHQGGELVHEELYVRAWDHTFSYQPPATVVYDAPPPSETPEARTEPVPGVGAMPAPASITRIDFARQVMPMLQDKCVNCHGPEKKKGGLRLDTEALALEGGDSGPAYVPGNAGESLIVRLIASEDDDEKMPPPSKGKVVTRPEFDALRTWIDQGAIWTGTGAKVTAKVSAVQK